MRCDYACQSQDHSLARRQFLGSMAAGLGSAACGFDALASPKAAEQLARDQKRVLVVFLAGGVSQLESWDPKPGTPTGGPFATIPTSVPGLHISELLPHSAKIMHHMAVVRGVNTRENNHGKGKYMMTTGRRQEEPGEFPTIGATVARALESGSAIPGHIQITPKAGGTRSNDSAYLGPNYASLSLSDGKAPADSTRHDTLTLEADTRRNAFRAAVNDRFLQRRRTARTDLYTQSFEQAQSLMAQREVFDVTKEAEADRRRYGDHDFGRHCLLARRLLENDATFVQVTHTNYDTHNENFNFHIEQLEEFDRPFANLIDDLHQRSMLESTLVVVMSEFGRTPRINHKYGRDHWGTAWSVVLGGCGIQKQAVYGKTNAQGTAVVDGQVDHARLFHTYLQAVGVDSSSSFDIAGRQFPVANPASYPIKELLA